MTDPALKAVYGAVGALLPRFTFITGPNGVGKSTLANNLFLNISQMQLFSFAEPIREALSGMFYQGDPTIDLTLPEIKTMPLPAFPEKKHREAMDALGDWYRSYFGEDAIGRYAWYRCQQDAEYYDQFIFDDARRIADLEPTLHNISSPEALLIVLSRPGVDFSQQAFRHDDLASEMRHLGVRVVELCNDSTREHLIAKLKTTLEVENTLLASGVTPSQL